MIYFKLTYSDLCVQFLQFLKIYFIVQSDNIFVFLKFKITKLNYDKTIKRNIMPPPTNSKVLPPGNIAPFVVPFNAVLRATNIGYNETTRDHVGFVLRSDGFRSMVRAKAVQATVFEKNKNVYVLNILEKNQEIGTLFCSLLSLLSLYMRGQVRIVLNCM